MERILCYVCRHCHRMYEYHVQWEACEKKCLRENIKVDNCFEINPDTGIPRYVYLNIDSTVLRYERSI